MHTLRVSCSRVSSHISGLRKTGDDEPLGADLAELQQAWVDSQSTPVAAELLEYGSEDEDESASE